MTVFRLAKPAGISLAAVVSSTGDVNAFATAFTLTLSSSTGTNGMAITVTVTPNGPIPTGGASVTLAASNGGTLGSTSLSFTSGSTAAQSTTHLRATSGTSVITMTNNIGLANNGSGVSFTSFAPAASGLPLWLSAPAGQWATISGTTAPGGVANNFSGVAWRVEPNAVQVLSALPGGHSAGTYATANPVYLLTLNTDSPAWVLRRAASDATGWSPTAPTTEYFPSDNRPVTRHTYGCNWWVPERGSFAIGGTFAGSDGSTPILEHREFKLIEDGGSDDWTARGTLPNKPVNQINIGARNSNTGEFFSGSMPGISPGVYYKWNPTLPTPTWAAITPTGAASMGFYRFAFDDRRNCVTSIGYYGGTERAVRMDWSTLAKTAITFSPSAGLTDYQTYLTAQYFATIKYNSNDDAYYIFNGNGGPSSNAALSGRIYKVYPNDAGAWDVALLPVAGSPYTTNITAGNDGRFEVIDKYRTAVAIHPNAPAYYYRLPFASQIVVRSGSVTGTVPYTATVLPLRGEVPSGYTVTSADDATMKASVISTHDDGSAAVVVLAGETLVTANTTKRLAVGIAATSADTALTGARIDALVTGITVDFAGTYGSASITDFTTPDHVWWANSKVICARYRIAAPTPGSTALEAIIDITAFGTGHDRALVEVVIENGRIDALASTDSTKPADATYTDATVTVNGSTVATASSSGAPTGTHQAFRSWYAKAWVGGDPETRATQRHIDLQRHPLLWRVNEASTADLSIYAADAYTPWSTGRQRGTNMGGGGSHPSIGPLPLWEAQALQSGDYRCWNAAEQSALAVLSFNVNYRDTTGFVPDAARMPTKWIHSTPGTGTWPFTGDTDPNQRGIWERAHQPAVGLMAFVARPSPVFIELAQKVAVTTGTISSNPVLLASPYMDSAGVGLTDLTGISVPTQTRSFAWGSRATTHATFLSPSGSSWRAGGQVWMNRIARMARAYQLLPEAQNLRLWDSMPSVSQGGDQTGGRAGKQASLFMWSFLITELYKASKARLCSSTEQAWLESFAQWSLEGPARRVNQQTNGAWRFIPYWPTYLKADNSSPATWAEQVTNDVSGTGPATLTGAFKEDTSTQTTWAQYNALPDITAIGNSYSGYWHMSLMCAVEAGVPGAATAYATVRSGVTNYATWLTGNATNPQWGFYPRANI